MTSPLLLDGFQPNLTGLFIRDPVPTLLKPFRSTAQNGRQS